MILSLWVAFQIPHLLCQRRRPSNPSMPSAPLPGSLDTQTPNYTPLCGLRRKETTGRGLQGG